MWKSLCALKRKPNTHKEEGIAGMGNRLQALHEAVHRIVLGKGMVCV